MKEFDEFEGFYLRQPEFAQLRATSFVGLEARFISVFSENANNLTVLPNLWGEFYSRAHELRSNDDSGAVYGLTERIESNENPNTARYLAAARVSDEAFMPPGMIRWESPGGLFAKFAHRGSVEKLGSTIRMIYLTWLPQSGFTRAQGPDIERYDHRFDPFGEQSVIEILIPIQ